MVSTLDPAPEAPPFTIPYMDKVAHFGAWALLAGALRFGFSSRDSELPRRRVSWALAFGYGLLIESLQAPMVTRSAEAMDLVADGLGALVGVWLVGRVMR